MNAHLSVAPVAYQTTKDMEPRSETRVSQRRKDEDSGVFRLLDLKSKVAHGRRRSSELHARFGPIVRRISLKTARSLPRTLAVDDIISAGWVGMSEAINRRPAEMPDDQFDAYASYRVRGAILDYLRALDPLSRRLRSLAREIQASTRELSHALGRLPEQDEVAKKMGITLVELQKAQTEIQESGVDHLDGVVTIDPPSHGPSPEHSAAQNQMMAVIARHMKELPERLQMVLTLHYQHDSSLREIGEVLGVTESRVCQLHAEAIQKIRARVDGQVTAPARRARCH
jgi:RNA polymerase sigma factor FliA